MKYGPLADADDAEGSAVELSALEDSLSLRVLSPHRAGKAEVVCTKRSATVADLAALIDEQMGVPVALQRLFHCGKELSRSMDEPLSSFSLESQTTIHLAVRPAAVAHPVARESGVEVVDIPSPALRGAVVPAAVLLSPEIQLRAQRVKLLASIMLLIFGLRSLLTIAVFLAGATAGLFDVAELALNIAGLYVGAKGLRAAATYCTETTESYCRGLACVALLYVSLQTFELVQMVVRDGRRAPAETTVVPADDEGPTDEEPDGGEDAETTDTGEADAADSVFTQLLMVIIAIAVWGTCLRRAHQFRESIAGTPTAAGTTAGDATAAAVV
jgi:hypothetical protein